MKINSINSNMYSPKAINLVHNAVPYPEYQKLSFGHSAVPYPEYEYTFTKQENNPAITKFIDKISSLFTPEVTQKSQEIKDGINKIYDGKKQNPNFNASPKEHLLSVLA